MSTKSVIIQLVEKFKDDKDILDEISRTLNSMSTYIDIVNRQEQLVTIDKYNLSKEQLLYEIKNLDTLRRSTHNGMIAGIKLINRICVSEGLEKFFNGNEEDRYEIADFAMKIVADTFARRVR